MSGSICHMKAKLKNIKIISLLPQKNKTKQND